MDGIITMDKLIRYGKTIVIHTPSNQQLSDRVLNVKLTSIVPLLPYNVCIFARQVTLILIDKGIIDEDYIFTQD